MTFNALDLAIPAIARLRAYDTGPDKLVARAGDLMPAELGSNEHAFGPSPKALAAMLRALPRAHRYPDPNGSALKSTLSTHFAVDPLTITLGNGSNELLLLLAECFAGPGRSVVYSQYAFLVYAIAAASVGVDPIEVPSFPREHSTMPLGHDLGAIAAAIRPDTALVYLANPNNPTGGCFDDDALDGFLSAVPPNVLVVLDEAYIDFVSPDLVRTAIDRIAAYPNLVVLRTFSKAHALAALRIGYAVSHPSTAAVLGRLRQTFNVNLLALSAAEAAFLDFDYFERSILATLAERDELATTLTELGYQVLPSQTNFLMVDVGDRALEIEEALYQAGVIVRPMGGYGLPQMLRISIGTHDETARLLAALPLKRV
ncbi:MAG: histidinol-phosphate transaminase [Dokdonella sp.]